MSSANEDRGVQIALGRKLESEGQQEAARHLFASLAERGDIEALTALGQNLLVREPLNSYEGVKTIIDAANKGGAEAIRLCGAMSAMGAGLAQNWSMALDCLQASAERDWRPAQDELRLLAAKSDGPWKALRNAIDMPSLLKASALRTVHTAPRISVVENFLSPELCDWLIARARPKIERARTFDAVAGAQIDSARNNGAAEFNFVEMDIVLALIRARISAVTGLVTQGFENAQILHYAVGQRFAPHYDYLDATVPKIAETIVQGGQREATFLVYLNDEFDGAETSFLKLDWCYRGQKGDAILFWNTDPTGIADTATLHAGLAPTRGEKWLLSQWIRRPPQR
jgi:prolyl 4-hydroxylase